ncbi:MAG TPA: exodeoxyribonuclease VII large subunit, partial [Longimicrobiales bacterium]
MEVTLDLFSQPVPEPREEPARGRGVSASDAAAQGTSPVAAPALTPDVVAGDVLEQDEAQPRLRASAMPRRTAALDRTYTPTQLNAAVRQLLDSCPAVWVSGEVTGWKRHGSGHCYFSLRDANAQVRCVMWRTEALRLPADPDEGTQVRVLGAVTLYEKRGEYQLVVRELESTNRGGLWRIAFEKLHAKLSAEGLLAPERKRPLPDFPRTLGVITSASGAALHDILHVVERRAPWTRVIFSPARVQGEGAAAEVARAIALFARAPAGARPDVLIVGRGGGSKDDLWAFNDERLARAIAACPVPVISAVGHETDVTIADLIADYRAPTPSAAAEAAVPDARALERRLTEARERLARVLRRRTSRAREDVQRAGTSLEECVLELVRERGERLARSAAQLEALSPLSALRRGYAVPLSPEGHGLRRAGEFSPGAAFRLRVVDGNVDCRVEGD